MRFIDFAIRNSPLYRRLKHEHEALHEKLRLLASANGAGPPGHANCDTEVLARFVSLDADYRALEKENAQIRLDAELGRKFETLR